MKQLLLLLLLGVGQTVVSQQTFPDNPLDAEFVLTDYYNFWESFEALDATDDNPFVAYLSNASDGLTPFVDYLNADSLYQTVLRRKCDYVTSRPVLDAIDTKKKEVQASYAAMKYWYPEATFPPVYFVVGMFTTGGTASENGLVIGSEMLETLDGLNRLISHELIHFQQNIRGTENLLKQVIKEGSADFLGELISGELLNEDAHTYVRAHEAALHAEFAASMLQDDYTDWLYGTSGKDDRPNDLGYWIGYKITEAYFDQHEDKHAAIVDILNIANPMEFLKQSGYLDAYID